MPLYEYECQACHRRTEKIQKFSDAELTVCPHCGGVLERTVTAPAFQFAGGGWYKDLYSSAKPDGAKPDAGGAGSGEASGKTTGGSEAAPASSETSSASPATAAASSTSTPAGATAGVSKA